MAPHSQDEVLIVDDEPAFCTLIREQLYGTGLSCHTAGSTEDALQLIESQQTVPVLVLSDVRMPGADGLSLLRDIKKIDESIQVVMISGSQDLETVRECLRQGAYDYLLKPFRRQELVNTVDRAVERCRLLRENDDYRRNLERMVEERTEELRQTRDIALFTLAKLADSRDHQTGLHMERIGAYSRCLAEALQGGSYDDQVDPNFIDTIEKSAPLHDIGKVGVPDHILLKPQALTEEEKAVMETHTTIGGDTLRAVIDKYSEHSFLGMAMEIAYSHHEKWDGSGYPQGLAAAGIPLAARIVAISDAYDALTSKRPYKEAMTHDVALERIYRDRGTHFDPVLLDALKEVETEFQRIRRELSEAENEAPKVRTAS